MVANHAGLSVLYVDDDPDFAERAADFMEKQDDRITVETAHSASDGLDSLSQNDFDCVVSDYDMPGTDGIEFLESVREEYPLLPFILYTGKGSEDIASEAISAGVTDYLQMGSGASQYEVLANRIQNAIDQRRARQEAAETEQRLQTIAEHTNDILWKFTGDWGELLFINSAYEEIWGRSVDELQTRPTSFLDGIHPEDRERVRDRMERLSAGESVDLEYRVNANEDFGRWVWVQAEPVFDEDGDVENVVGFARDITKRKRQAERYEALIEHSMDVITVLDDTGTISYESPSVERILGYEPEQLIGENALEYIHPDDRDRISLFRDLLDQPESEMERATYRFEHADGQWVWLETVGRIDHESPIDSYVLNSRDVTERVTREHELERYKTYLESARDAITVTDADGVIQFESPAIADILGYEPDERVGEYGYDYVHPDDREIAAESFQQAIEEGQGSESVELRIRHKDGSWRWIDNRPNYHLDDPDIEGIVTSVRDVTERKRRERELENLREQTSFVLEETNTVIYSGDPETNEPNTLYRDLEDLVGIDSSSIDGVEGFLNQVVHPDDRAELLTAYQRLVQGESNRLNVEFRIDPDLGREQWLEATAFLRSNGESRELIGLIADITDHKEHERELERQNQRLDEFAHVISHDLRNPLTVAKGHLELAREGVNTEHLDAIERAHERMQNMIDDVLALAEEDGEVVSDFQAVSLGEVVEESWATVETGEASLDVESRPIIQADEGRLRHLLENLIRNAVEHGGENVTVSVGDVEGGFYVKDDGTGIPEADREQIFESGYSKSGTGTGLGLSIVDQVVEAHGWEIHVSESDAGGAQFEITGVETVE